MRTTWFAFASDLVDEGLDRALDRMGGDGVSVAGVYHTARDLFPHNPVRRVRYLEGGTHYFAPDRSLYRPLGIQPAHDAPDGFDVARTATARRGLALHAWMVYLHNSRLGRARPDLTEHNLFGDPQLTDLCPANPTVRAYAVALTRDVARYGCEAVLAESLHYHPLGHGYHHERYLFRLDPLAELLLGLCFCQHCVQAGRAAGVDMDAVTRFARQRVEGTFAGDPGPDSEFEPGELTRRHVDGLAGGELGAFLDARGAVVTGLVGEVAAALSASAGDATRLYFLDPSGAAKGYATGEPTGGPAADAGWQVGVDPAAIAARGVGYQVLGYARDPARLRLDVAAYRDALGFPPRVVLRPTAPDCPPPSAGGPDNLNAKLTALRDLNVEEADFYHYGLIPLSNVAMVSSVLGAAGTRG